MPLAEAYADATQDIGLAAHGAEDVEASFMVNFWAWFIIVLALVILWLLGGVAFKSINK